MSKPTVDDMARAYFVLQATIQLLGIPPNVVAPAMSIALNVLAFDLGDSINTGI